MIDERSIDERVRRGAALLDEKQPGWVDDIDPERLHLGNCERCVLGQLFGDYEDGLAELDDPAETGPWLFGFDSMGEGYENLTDAWRQLIRERRAAADHA